MRQRFEHESKTTVKATSAGITGVLFSTFGVYLLVLVLSSVANNGINNQIANILPNVYGIDEATTSALISLAGLLNIGFFLLAGWWMGQQGGSLTASPPATCCAWSARWAWPCWA